MSSTTTILALAPKLGLKPEELKQICLLLGIPIFTEKEQELLKPYQINGRWSYPVEALTKLHEEAQTQKISVLQAAQAVAMAASQQRNTPSNNTGNENSDDQYDQPDNSSSVRMIQDVEERFTEALDPVALFMRIGLEKALIKGVIKYMNIPSSEIKDPRLEDSRAKTTASFFLTPLLRSVTAQKPLSPEDVENAMKIIQELNTSQETKALQGSKHNSETP